MPKVMIQSNNSSPRESEVTFEYQKGKWSLKSPGMKRFLDKGKMKGGEGVGFDIKKEQIWGA